MSDERARDLERRARAGDVHARAALITERRRAGRLTLDRVWIAAALGDEAARLVDGIPHDEACETNWISWPASQGQEVALRIVLAALEAAWPVVRERWTEDEQARIEEQVNRLRLQLRSWPGKTEEAPPPLRWPTLLPADHPFAWAFDAAHRVARSGVPDEGATIRVVELASQVAGERAVREALRRDVAPWALGLD